MSCLTSTDALDAPTSPLFGGASALDDFNTKPTMSGGDESMSSFLSSAWDAPRSGVAPPSGTTTSGGDDFFSSPLWTDPSPALTDGNTFDVESCGPSPLLATDDLERPAADVANMPLFGDMTLFSPAVRGDHHQSVAAPDFPLFPQAETMGVPAPPASSSPSVPRAPLGC